MSFDVPHPLLGGRCSEATRIERARRAREKADPMTAIREEEARLKALGEAKEAYERKLAAGEIEGLTGSLERRERKVDGDVLLRTIEVSEDIYGGMHPVGHAKWWLIHSFRLQFRRRPFGEEWTAWLAEKDYAPQGLIFLIGFSQNVPDKIVSTVYEEFAFQTYAIQGSRSASEGFRPLLWAGDAGIELLSEW